MNMPYIIKDFHAHYKKLNKKRASMPEATITWKEFNTFLVGTTGIIGTRQAWINAHTPENLIGTKEDNCVTLLSSINVSLKKHELPLIPETAIVEI